MAGAETDQLRPQPRGFTVPIEVSAITAILALALALMAGAGAALYQRSKPAAYGSFAVLLIDQPIALANSPDGGPLLKLQQLRYYYADLLKTQVITGPVSRQVNLPEAVIANDVNAVIDPTSFTINIFATAKNPRESNQVAQAATAELVSYVAKQQAHLQIPPINRVVLEEVSQPALGIKAVTPLRKVLLAGGVGFVVVGAAFLIVADLLRRRW